MDHLMRHATMSGLERLRGYALEHHDIEALRWVDFLSRRLDGIVDMHDHIWRWRVEHHRNIRFLRGFYEREGIEALFDLLTSGPSSPRDPAGASSGPLGAAGAQRGPETVTGPQGGSDGA